MSSLTHAQVEEVEPSVAGQIEDIFEFNLFEPLVTTTRLEERRGRRYPGHSKGNVA